MSIDQQIKMGTSQPPTPLELAHLSAALVHAEIVKQSSPPSQLAEALQYLDSCSEAIALHEANRAAEQTNKRIKSFLAEFDLNDDQKLQIPSEFIVDSKPIEAKPVPMERIVTFFQAHRIKPSESELRAIKEPRRWAVLSKADQLKAIFLVLTQTVCPWPVGYVPLESDPGADQLRTFFQANIEDRRGWLKRGVPFHEAETHIYIMLNAMRERASIKGRKGAEKKRRKPRAPKGAGGQYGAKERDSGPGGTQKFKTQKK